jgi:hypothetical protein
MQLHSRRIVTQRLARSLPRLASRTPYQVMSRDKSAAREGSFGGIGREAKSDLNILHSRIVHRQAGQIAHTRAYTRLGPTVSRGTSSRFSPWHSRNISRISYHACQRGGRISRVNTGGTTRQDWYGLATIPVRSVRMLRLRRRRTADFNTFRETPHGRGNSTASDERTRRSPTL